MMWRTWSKMGYFTAMAVKQCLWPDVMAIVVDGDCFGSRVAGCSAASGLTESKLVSFTPAARWLNPSHLKPSHFPFVETRDKLNVQRSRT